MRRETEHQARRNCFCRAVCLPMTDRRQERDGLFVLRWGGDRGDFAVEGFQGHVNQGEDRGGVRFARGLAIQSIDGYVDEAVRVGIECRRGGVGINGAGGIPRIERQDRLEEPIHAEVSLGQGPFVVLHQPQKLVPLLVRNSSWLSVLGSLGTVREVGNGRERTRSRRYRTPVGVDEFSTFDRSEAGVESADSRADFIDLGTHPIRKPPSHHSERENEPDETEAYIELVVHNPLGPVSSL